MFFLNLSLGEFLGALGILSGVVTALYLLDRSKKRRVVSTLRFWTAAPGAEERQSRRRMRDPWSLVIQLASLLLLLLAIAQLQWGKREQRGRDNVVLLDTSSWTSQLLNSETVLAREKALVQQYQSGLRSSDRVMLVRVDALATPVTPFTSDQAEIRRRLAESSSGLSSLNISQALAFADQALRWNGRNRGEIVYFGPKLTDEAESATVGLHDLPRNLRIVPVETSRENCGIRRVSVRRNEEDANSWQALVTLKNYGTKPTPVRLQTAFAGTRFGTRTMLLEPSKENVAEYNFATNSPGQFTAEIKPGDALSADDRCQVELPRNGLLRVAVYTRRPEAFRALFGANHFVTAEFFAPESFSATRAADLVVLDGFSPSQAPAVPALWLSPPRQGSPVPAKAVVPDAELNSWRSETPLGAGLHAKGERIPNAEVFQTFEGDSVVGSVAEGPIVIARDAKGSRPRQAVIGFDAVAGDLRFQVTTPLLFANLIGWLAPESFRTYEVDAGRVGSTTVVLDPAEANGRISVRDNGGLPVPFTARNGLLELFEGQPAIVHVLSGGRERVLSLTLPDVASNTWSPPRLSVVGMPSQSRLASGALDLWQWLALLGGAGLLCEWLLFGSGKLRRKYRGQSPSGRPPLEPQTRTARERDLVSR